jgi:hypothetical protein
MVWVRLTVLVMVAVLLAGIVAFAGTPGSFRGILIEGADTKPGWMYVQSRNAMLRLVQVKNAQVYYGEEIPQHLRRPDPAESLRPGAEVRITADDVGHGHWRAREIEILNLAPVRRAEK